MIKIKPAVVTEVCVFSYRCKTKVLALYGIFGLSKFQWKDQNQSLLRKNCLSRVPDIRLRPFWKRGNL